MWSLTLTAGGTGYTSAPTVSIASGAGTAVAAPTATATIGAATLGGTVSSITLNTPGTGYTSRLCVLDGRRPGRDDRCHGHSKRCIHQHRYGSHADGPRFGIHV